VHEKLGCAVVALFEGCDPQILNSRLVITRLTANACREAGATVLKTQSVQFAPSGVSTTSILAESHAGNHTWPESGRAVFVVYTCGDVDPMVAVRLISQGLRAQRFVVRKVSVDGLLFSEKWVVMDDG
jgi:S-adenosylmethionine decarboxylase